ncbi:hypothetical protein ACCO45_005502 [Purpureocillium lilacinum]|uniref:Uncharacterized protein n=1 Tax=Purpureocillium lilacinum TaxID=33203 RepID=A0ACC4DVL5_PURLI
MFAPSSPALESSASRAIGAIVSPRPQDLAATAIDSYRFTSTYPAHDRSRWHDRTSRASLPWHLEQARGAPSPIDQVDPSFEALPRTSCRLRSSASTIRTSERTLRPRRGAEFDREPLSKDERLAFRTHGDDI